MLHGKKGFERIVWAFENVLNESVAWLFCDRASGQKGWNFLKTEISNNSNIIKDSEDEPLQKHQPQIIECDMVQTSHRQVLVPPSLHMPIAETIPSEQVQEHWGSLAEWLAMVFLESPRVDANDTIDPYLSRYAVSDVENSSPSDLISLKWHGFINPQWVTKLFINLL